MHIDDYECAFTRPHFDNVVTSMVEDLVSDNRTVRWEVFPDGDGRSTSVDVFWNEGTKHPKLNV